MVILQEHPTLPGSSRVRLDQLAVFTLAFVVRMAFVITSTGGVAGVFGYDAGVYYTSAASLLRGSMPYRDFTLLHPPGVVLALTPFAVVGRLTTDHIGFIVANTAFVALAAANAAMVVVISRRIGVSRAAALLGGTFYAVWPGAVGAEMSVRLEPLGSFAFLCGVLFLMRGGAEARRTAALAGAAIGVAGCVKIWWCVPALVVAFWLVRTAGMRHRVPAFAAGFALSVVLVAGPFLERAPKAMWRMVVADQLGRPAARSSGFARVTALASLHTSVLPLAVGFVVVTATLVLRLAARAWRRPAGRVLVLILCAQVVVLLAAPTYFGYYADYLAPAGALLVATAAKDRRPSAANASAGRVWPDAARTSVAGAAVLTIGALVFGSASVSTPFPGGALARGVSQARCVMADSPMALIELDDLSRNLNNRCRNWVDVSGRTYDVDASAGGYRPRRTNQRWQSDILRYLRSGDAAIVIRSATGLDAHSLKVIRSWPVLTRSRGITIYRPPTKARP